MNPAHSRPSPKPQRPSTLLLWLPKIRASLSVVPGPRSRDRTRGDIVPSLSVLPTWVRVPAALSATALGGVGMGAPRFALLASHQLPTCLTELAQGLRQTRRLGGLFLRRPRGPPLAPRPVCSIPGGLQAPQGHGRRVNTSETGGRRSRGQWTSRAAWKLRGTPKRDCAGCPKWWRRGRGLEAADSLQIPAEWYGKVSRRHSHSQVACEETMGQRLGQSGLNPYEGQGRGG